MRIADTSMQPDKATRRCSPVRTLHMGCGCSLVLRWNVQGAPRQADVAELQADDLAVLAHVKDDSELLVTR